MRVKYTTEVWYNDSLCRFSKIDTGHYKEDRKGIFTTEDLEEGDFVLDEGYIEAIQSDETCATDDFHIKTPEVINLTAKNLLLKEKLIEAEDRISWLFNELYRKENKTNE
jgi:hypothetical protein